MIEVPCEKCEYRSIACHASCKQYKKFRKLKDKENDKRRTEAYKYGKFIQRFY